MSTYLHHLWEKLSASYWFLPSLMLLGATVLAAVTLGIDHHFYEPADHPGRWLYGGGAQGARTLLSTIGGSIITVAGVVFSITIAALTQAATQFGPRLLRNFMRDTGNQLTLGTFVATFLYCVLVLRSIPEQAESVVPHLSVTVAVALAVASLGVLVYFIHHVSFGLQAPAVVATVWQELRVSMRRPYPGALGDDGPPPPRDPPPPGRRVPAPASGFIQAIDGPRLLRLACEHNLQLRVPHRPGKFVIAGTPVLEILGNPAVGHQLGAALARAFLIGRHRTPEQDLEFTFDQMVEIAVRALSPGVNDPFTAITCVDWLAAALCEVITCGLPTPHRYDPQGTLRIVTDASDFRGLADAAFHQIRQYGRGSAAVTVRLLEALTTVASCARTDAQRAALRRHAQLVADAADALPAAADRSDTAARFAACTQHLTAPLPTPDAPGPLLTAPGA